MSKAAIDAYARAEGGVGLSALLRRVDSERQVEARKLRARGDLFNNIGSFAQTGAGAVSDFKLAKAGNYKGSFINFLTASPVELSPFIELGKTVGVQPNENGGLLDALDSLGKNIFKGEKDKLGQVSHEGGDFFGRKP